MISSQKTLPVKTSPWKTIALKRGKKESKKGLSPWWSIEGADIKRTVYLATLSKQAEHLENLGKGLSVYRLALGQADQEYLLEALNRRIDEVEHGERKNIVTWLQQAKINLSPFFNNRS